MNRSNVGNVVTNGIQIESVAATTAAKYLRGQGRTRDDATTRLNNTEKVPHLETGTEYNKRFKERPAKEGEVEYPEKNQNQIEEKANETPKNIFVDPKDFEVTHPEEDEGDSLANNLELNEYSGQAYELSRYIRNNNNWIKSYDSLHNVGIDDYTKKFASLKKEQNDKKGENK